MKNIKNKKQFKTIALTVLQSYALTVLLVCLLNSCNTIRYVPVEKTTETKTEIVEVVRDTTIYIPPDQATLKALLECDSTGQILIKQVETLQGKLNAKANIRIVDNTIIADCICDSLNIYMQLKDRYQTTTVNITETKIQMIEKELKWLQKMLLWVGCISLIAITIGSVLILKKRIF
jgi:hypothetical protein